MKFSTDAKIATALFVVLLSFFLLIMSGTMYSFDGILMFQQARTLVGQHTLLFPEPIRWDSLHPTSKYGIGMSLAYLPALVPLSFFRPDLFTPDFFDNSIPFNNALLSNQLYLYSSWLNPFITALLGVVLYGLARFQGMSQRRSVLVVLIMGIASPLTAFARYDLAQPLVALELTAAFLFVLLALKRGQYRYWFLAGVCLGYGFLTRSDFVLVAVWLYLLCLFSPRTSNAKPTLTLDHLKGMIVMSIPFLIGIALYPVANYLRYGSPWNFGYEQGFTTFGWVTGWIGLLVSPGTGLFVYFPLALLGLWMIWQEARQREVPAIAVGGLCITYWLFFGLWGEWWGGWSWGPRFLTPLVPLLTLYAVKWLAGQSKPLVLRLTFAAMTGVGFLAALNGTLFNPLSFFSNYFGKLTDEVVLRDHFGFAASPLFAGWDWGQQINHFDLWWLQNLIWTTNPFTRYGWVGLLIIMGAGGVLLICWLAPAGNNSLEKPNTAPLGV